ncbi:hypothetical protein [Rheinheimera salexigens]|uniref:Uncharacterized protein n=1 Tax=Rheinheimera salexigens TaxID=1628148 RepID=A0A1E7Q2Z7_9GAMM|nr:hypothetical protein [Rheinheimera salexigens]OEY68527.1 hypothetical protein BI198_02285 [Rheinheimera salexigens]
MPTDKNKYLMAAAISTTIAALAHLGCIIFGADWYRFLGAGEQMAQLAENGYWYPTVVTSVLVAVLLLWSLYALSGAGLIKRLPLLRLVLCAIASILLIRAVGFVYLIPFFPGNSLTFWLVSSGICLVMGAFYAVGTYKAWPVLKINRY